MLQYQMFKTQKEDVKGGRDGRLRIVFQISIFKSKFLPCINWLDNRPAESLDALS